MLQFFSVLFHSCIWSGGLCWGRVLVWMTVFTWVFGRLWAWSLVPWVGVTVLLVMIVNSFILCLWSCTIFGYELFSAKVRTMMLTKLNFSFTPPCTLPCFLISSVRWAFDSFHGAGCHMCWWLCGSPLLYVLPREIGRIWRGFCRAKEQKWPFAQVWGVFPWHWARPRHSLKNLQKWKRLFRTKV